MLAGVERLTARRPHLRVDLRLTSGFGASAAAAPDDLSRGLMSSKVCLAPRGTSVETFRLLEGLRAGCVVVGGRLPRHSFYVGAPVIQLDRWRHLDRVLLPLLDRPDELRRLHSSGLDWWRSRCSEQAVGRFMAEKLNEVSQQRFNPASRV
jgi:hypothetical protein